MEIIEFKNNELILIDQTKLPLSEEYVTCRTVEEVASAIKTMVVRGAPAIGITAAYGMVIGKDPKNDSETLKQARPTAVDLSNAVNYMLREIKEGKNPEIAAREWHQKIIEKTKKISENGASLIKSGDTVLLHCNAGPLATGAYGTSLGAALAAHKQGKKIFVYVDETRPRFQGALTSWELKKAGVPHKVIVDSSAGALMRMGKVNCIMVGADRIVKNGDFANKIGTYPLSILAKENKIPFYVLAPISTFDFKAKNGKQIVIEERNGKEVLEIQGKRIYAEGIEATNLAFDVTPKKYVSAYITEFGVHKKVLEVKDHLGVKS